MKSEKGGRERERKREKEKMMKELERKDRGSVEMKK